MGCRKVTVFLPPNRQGNKGMPKIPEKLVMLRQFHENTCDIVSHWKSPAGNGHCHIYNIA